MCTSFAAAGAHVLISYSFDTDFLLSCMENLENGKIVAIPNYDFKTYESVSRARKVPLAVYSYLYDLILKSGPNFMAIARLILQM